MVLLGAFLVCEGVANAAQISATANEDTIAVGQSTTVEVFLALEPGEEASLFEGHIELAGTGSVASAVLAPGGPSWGSSLGNLQANQATVSLTSNNAGGTRLVASLAITGVAAGTFDVVLGSPAPQAAFDIANPPYLQSLAIDTDSGTLLASVIVSDAADTDGDGVADDADNCTFEANPSQLDTDGDGHGNRCDADLNQDCIVNPVDLGIIRSVFFSADPDADLNGDGVVNPIDLGIFRALFFGTPGPSAPGSLCNP